MAGLICAYLDKGSPSERTLFAYRDVLQAIRKKKDITNVFQSFEKALIADEENLRAFLECYK